MIKAILGKKIKQSQTFTDDGVRISTTVIEAGPCVVTHIATQEKNGYRAIQLGFGQKSLKNTTKPIVGHLKKAGIEDNKTPRFFREINLTDLTDKADKTDTEVKLGDIVTVDKVFKVGDSIQAMGTSKGKGWAGVVKRYHFAGGPRTHGQSDRERAPGSIGQTTTPGRVYKGKRMAGRMGNARVTVKNLKVVSIDPEKNLLVVKGLVPGGKNSLLTISKV